MAVVTGPRQELASAAKHVSTAAAALLFAQQESVVGMVAENLVGLVQTAALTTNAFAKWSSPRSTSLVAQPVQTPSENQTSTWS